MKVRMIYKDDTQIEDMSQDRVELNLSYKEWELMRDFISSVKWFIEEPHLKKEATEIYEMYTNHKLLEPKWEK